MPARPSEVAEPRNILIRGVNWLGDAIMTLPALQRLRERFPEARISVFGPDKLKPLWSYSPAVNHAISFADGETSFAAAQRLRSEGFDLALVLPNSPRSALETWLAGIPRRVGYAKLWRNWFLSTAVGPRPGHAAARKRTTAEIHRLTRVAHPGKGDIKANATASGYQAQYTDLGHQTRDYLHLASVLGADPQPTAPILRVQDSEKDAARQSLRSMFESAPGSPPPQDAVFLGMAPSAAYGPAKRWPAESFAAVAREVSAQGVNACWVAFGADTDRDLCERIAARSGIRILNLAGRTSLGELVRALSVCRALLTNDSGPMHVAAAVGTSVVAVFGSTSPELTGPGLAGDPRHQVLTARVPCSPCFRRTCPIDYRCLLGIGSSTAAASLLRVIEVGED